jgi:hypothetical protein
MSGSGTMSRTLKELKSLSPWGWDAKLETAPVGQAALRDFEKVRGLLRLLHHAANRNALAGSHAANGRSSAQNFKDGTPGSTCYSFATVLLRRSTTSSRIATSLAQGSAG